ncbi:lytic transglycosylase domain-containing protein [Mesorhizobium sp. B1-1-8]|uniref:lytic transglycosylase domain-containing protein n=1 Tax=Mesorhizobium sp. B1-1-8 TaxID=2589976 RepID=UPI00112E81B9|nr:lytic transglycosylase domain-containing protein [Mesorhizobium sp. B1-1-8]UCI09513.1 lytic transglycosylase domain-containing protein [Mesorhizobium sp. B1-1-8]
MSARRRLTHHSGPPALRCPATRPALALLRGLCLTCVVPAIALAQNPTVVTPSARNSYESHIAEAARRFRLPAAWIRAVLGVESAGDLRATSRKGAMGLMQIVPETWSDLRLRYRLGGDPYDPHDNIIAGSAYIRELLDRYGSPGWIAAYNAGPGRYEMSLQGRRLPHETRAYVAAVASAIVNDGTMNAISPAVSARLGWKHAPLFFAQPNGGPAGDLVQQGRPRDDASRSLIADEALGAVPRPDGLFVPKASDRSTP